MTYTYKLVSGETFYGVKYEHIIRTDSDGNSCLIPINEGNTDYQLYLLDQANIN